MKHQRQKQQTSTLSMVDRYHIHRSLHEESCTSHYGIETISEACRELGIDDIPSEFICPITMEVIIVPVISIYGHSYEREYILRWIDQTGTCPCSRQPLRRQDVTPNTTLQNSIEKWLWMNGLPNIALIQQQQQQQIQEEMIHNHMIQESALEAPTPQITQSIMDMMLMMH